jgi:tetratricopeptide (TPR) repeat protein
MEDKMKTIYTLESFYDQGHLKKGKSEKVDRLIVGLKEYFHKETFKHDSFSRKWQDFLFVLIHEFPNISDYNLSVLETTLLSRGLTSERLLLCRYIVELTPQSNESWCFLGHAYRGARDLQRAVECYKKAYELATERIKQKNLGPNFPIHLDASDYLRYLAEAESELGYDADAFVHATRSFSILRVSDFSNDVHKNDAIYRTIYEICFNMKNMEVDDLSDNIYHLIKQKK